MKKLVLFLVVLGILAGFGFSQPQISENGILSVQAVIKHFDRIVSGLSSKDWVEVKPDKLDMEQGWQTRFVLDNKDLRLTFSRGKGEKESKIAFTAWFKNAEKMKVGKKEELMDVSCYCYFEGASTQEGNNGSNVFLWFFGKGIFDKFLKPPAVAQQ